VIHGTSGLTIGHHLFDSNTISIPLPYFVQPVVGIWLASSQIWLERLFHCIKSHGLNNRLEGLVWHIKIYSIFSRMWARIPRA
jgi:hypothetical protein